MASSSIEESDRAVDYNRKDLIAYLERTLKQKLQDTTIRAITVNPVSHFLPKMRIEVGQVCAHLEADAPPEVVVGIFESKLFVVCTPTRGAMTGLPYFFVRQDVRKVEFEDE